MVVVKLVGVVAFPPESWDGLLAGVFPVAALVVLDYHAVDRCPCVKASEERGLKRLLILLRVPCLTELLSLVDVWVHKFQFECLRHLAHRRRTSALRCQNMYLCQPVWK